MISTLPDYASLPKDEIVKIATELRGKCDVLQVERDALRNERDMLRQAVRNDMRRFCEHSVPDFEPLGGNRPDCAVATCATVSLSAATDFRDQSSATEYPLPPDVFACAAGILCAPVIIDGSDTLREAALKCRQKGPARTFSARLRFINDSDAMFRYCEGYGSGTCDRLFFDDTTGHRVAWPWIYGDNEYQTVTLKVELSPDILKMTDRFLLDISAPSVLNIDLRSTRLTAIGDHCLGSRQLHQVQLPNTITAIGDDFLAEDYVEGTSSWQCPIQSLDLSHLTGLKSIGSDFLRGCRLTELRLPPSVKRIGKYFLAFCEQLLSVDLSATKIKRVSHNAMDGCTALTEVKLPKCLTSCGRNFLSNTNISILDLRYLTRLTSLGTDFMSESRNLWKLYLPDSLSELPEGLMRDSGVDEGESVCYWGGEQYGYWDGQINMWGGVSEEENDEDDEEEETAETEEENIFEDEVESWLRRRGLKKRKRNH